MKSMKLLMLIVLLLAVAGPALPAGRSFADVFGDDERQQITRTFERPWRAIAFLEMLDAKGEVAGGCTGSLVGPDVVLTAGHCLFRPFLYGGDGFTTGVRVVPAKNGDEEPYGSVDSDAIWVSQAYVESGGADASQDWGIIRLPEPLGFTVGWFVIGQLRTETLLDPGARPVIVGYPADKPLGTLWAAGEDAFARVARDFLWHEIDVFKGQSGSGVFYTKPGSLYRDTIVGIHQLSRDLEDIQVSAAHRVTHTLLSDVLEACEALGCTIDFLIEPDPRPYKAFAPAITRAR